MKERVEIYIDESGHASVGEVFALAGLGGTSRQWVGFADEWGAVMHSAGLTKPFHAVEFEGARGQFEQFRDRRDEWRAIHDGLTDVILRHKLTMMGAVVPLPVWRQMDAESRRTNDPYFLATEAIVSGVACDGELTTGGELDLAFYFEKRKDTAAAAERMFHAIRAHPLVAQRERLTSFEFGGKSWPELQAADLVAYEVRKRVLVILADDTAMRWQYEKIAPHLFIGSVTITRKDGVED
ncbi:MAG: DUF3800 domain-containing protein [Acidobacteriota bacterium]